MSDPVFTFQPRWKEELLCSCSEGSFVLEMPMGIASEYAITGSMARQSTELDERVLDRTPDTTQPVVRRE